MRSFLRFLTTPTADTPGTTLLLHFDNKRYLIGSVAEGTQRASVQQAARLLKVSEIFITGRSEWSNVGGLIGMILTLADAASSSASTGSSDLRKKLFAKLRREGTQEVDEKELARQLAQEIKEKTSLRIIGPPNLNYLLATARRFVFRKGMPVDVQEILDHHSVTQTSDSGTQEFLPTWSDENIKVWAMSILPSSRSPSTSVPSDGAVSPRKRSYDELNGGTTDKVISEPDRERTTMMAKSVVSHMFDSDWRLDALSECSINEVKLPAALFVRDEATGKIVKYTGPMPGGTEPVPDIKVLVRRPWPGALVASLPPTKPAPEAMSYIVSNHRQRGKFRPERATELQVPKGAKWSRLTNGESVENDLGETITPDMVLEEGKDGGAAAIIDLPSVEYVEALVNRPEWKASEVMTGLGVFVWILGPGVAASPVLRNFISEMKQMQHVVASPDVCSNKLAMRSSAQATARLMKVDPARYGIPVHDNTDPLSTTGGEKLGDTIAEPGVMVQLEPSIEVRNDEVSPALNLEAVLSDMSSEVTQAAAEAQDEIKKSKPELDAWASKLPQQDAEIITLGTGSALPSKYRNVSATLLRVPGWGSLLFDCGENTLGQLKRLYTEHELKEVLHDLRAIWISHLHADHHLGTVSVIKAWYEAVHHSQPVPVPSPASAGFNARPLFENQKRLAVVSDTPMLHWLHEYSNVEDYGYSRIAPLAISPAYPKQSTPSQLTWFMGLSGTQSYNSDATEPHADKIVHPFVPPTALGLLDIQAVLVQHCHGARAVSITWNSGFKASYSGDCRPSKAFAQIGKGSTVCIHEATFDDELRGDAQAKNHSTTSEALNVALAMNAKACVLTHFSQRYQKVPVLEYTDQDDAMSSDDAEALDDGSEIRATSDDAPMTDVDVAATYDPVPLEGNAPAPLQPETKQTTIKLRKGTDMKICVAFDFMRVKVGEIAQLEKMTPALIKLFAKEEEEEEAKESEVAVAKPKPAANKKQKSGKGKRNN